MFKKLSTKDLVFIGILIALNVVFVRFLSFYTGTIRISFGFITNAIAGMLLGPVWGGVTAVLSDVFGMLVNPQGGTYFPLFSVSEFLYGFTYGLLLYKGDKSMLKIAIGIVVQFILVNLILTSVWLYIYNIVIVGSAKGYWVIFYSRLGAAAVNLPLQVVGVQLIARYLEPQLRKIKGR